MANPRKPRKKVTSKDRKRNSGRSVVRKQTSNSDAIVAPAKKKVRTQRRPRVALRSIESRALEIICKQLGTTPERINKKTSFINDLVVDSLDTVELVMRLEDEFEVSIPDEDAERIQTVGSMISYLTRKGATDESLPPDTHGYIVVRIDPRGVLQPSYQLGDGSWLYADGSRKLPSGLLVPESLDTASRRGIQQALTEFKSLLNDDHSLESDYQELWERYPFLIQGDQYKAVIPQAVVVPFNKGLPRLLRPDIVLIPHDQLNFPKILELKSPTQRLFRRSLSRHAPFYHVLYSAIEQLKSYALAFQGERTREIFQNRYGVEMFRPDLHLVIGRRKDFEGLASGRANMLIKLKQAESGVRISTYDDFYDEVVRRSGSGRSQAMARVLSLVRGHKSPEK